MGHKKSFFNSGRGSGKNPAINSLVAAACIVIYILAIVIAAIRIFINTNEYRGIAGNEFYEMVDRAAAAAALGFMSQPYQDTLREIIMESKTLQGVIISGPRGEYAFDRVQGNSIAWVGDSPRFKQFFGLSPEPFETALWVEGQEGLRIRAVYDTINYPFFIESLKYALVMITAALALAFLTLLVEAVLGKGGRKGEVREPRREAPPAARPAPVSGGSGGAKKAETGELYSPRSNVCGEGYTRNRLTRELHRASAAEGDLALVVMDFKDPGLIDGEIYRRFAGEAVQFFGRREFIFERGAAGLTVIMPGAALDQALGKAEEFLPIAAGILPAEGGFYAGISSRSGREVEADRLLFEAGAALERARGDPAPAIIAFKIDPEKYRAFMASRLSIKNEE